MCTVEGWPRGAATGFTPATLGLGYYRQGRLPNVGGDLWDAIYVSC